MGRFVNPDNSAFYTAIRSEIYVDKTGFLSYTNKMLGTKQAFICNSRPRRFGKSITADMLAAYYSKGCDSREMFSDLEISKSPEFEKYLNKYDVIHFDLQWFIAPDNETGELVKKLQEVIVGELQEEYPQFLDSGVKGLPDAMSVINEKTGNKFVVVVDEWDVLIRDEAQNQKVQEEYINFLRRMFKGTELTKYVALADRQLNNWLHDYLYKKNYSIEIGKIMRDKYESGLIRNEYEFKEVLNNVLSDSERS